MSLIERYVHEVGRHLPRKTRADIQAELHSLLVDTLEDRVGPEASEAQVVEFLKEYGPPKTVAASYHPQGQYLIGPALYPLFKLVTGITFAAVLGAQLLAWGIALLVDREAFAPFQALGGLLTAFPSALGIIVIVFFLLQRFEVRPEGGDDEWNPKKLPKIDGVEPVKRGERIFGMVVQIAILVLLVFFPQWIGFVTYPGGEFFVNPVIQEYMLLIGVSILFSLWLDIYLLWQGRWTTPTRLAKIGLNLLSVTILLLLVQGHTAWLAERGSSGILDALKSIPSRAEASWQIIGMQAFRFAFVVAALATIAESAILIYRLVRDHLRKDGAALTIPPERG
jgi:hypothetical protein